ncbi:MAG: diguanylate cyclase [Candidatus Omnitrophica bacterium]|nr:diguanylate cyclase [Candidatus Omnitrophota bacterium]
MKNFRDFIYQRTFRYKYRIRWALALFVALIVILLYQFDVLERLELITLDYRFRLRASQPLKADIVFIDMAEDSIQDIGRWPWPRSWHATLIKAVSDHKPKAIVFDVLFSEPQDPADDGALEEAIKGSGVVCLPLLFDLKEQSAGSLYKGEGVSSLIEPLPQFAKYAEDVGHINAIPDMDGILRRVPPLISFRERTAYQLGLKVGMDALGVKDGDISFYPEKHEIVAKAAGNKTIKIPLDEKNQFIINWKARWGKEFKHFSYINVIKSYALAVKGLASPIDFNEFRGKICVVGLTAAGLTDIKPVPVENAYPAVGINAMVINSVITNDFIYSLPRYWNMLIILLVSIIVTLYLSNLRLIGGMALATMGIVSYAVLSTFIFGVFNIAVATFYPILAIGLSYSLTSLYAQILQSIERARLFRQATRDGLTNLYNIRHFNLLFEAEFRNASVYKSKRLAIIMADIDNFKHINDTYGHQAGDTILREFAKIIQSKCRQTDVVARYGGEEFVVMLSGAGQKDALDIAEKIREGVQNKKFRFKNDNLGTTISMGVVEFSKEHDKEELVEKADKALYKAKEEGKNRVCVG